MEYRRWMGMGQCRVGPALVRIQRCCWKFPLLLFFIETLFPPKTSKLSCHAFVLSSDPFYWLPGFYRRRAGSKSSHSLKCRWALVFDSAAQLFLSPALPPGLLGGSCIGLKVIDEAAIRHLSVSLLWCQRDEGEIKRGWRSGFSNMSPQRSSACVLLMESGSKKWGLNL